MAPKLAQGVIRSLECSLKLILARAFQIVNIGTMMEPNDAQFSIKTKCLPIYQFPALGTCLLRAQASYLVSTAKTAFSPTRTTRSSIIHSFFELCYVKMQAFAPKNFVPIFTMTRTNEIYRLSFAIARAPKTKTVVLITWCRLSLLIQTFWKRSDRFLTNWQSKRRK